MTFFRVLILVLASTLGSPFAAGHDALLRSDKFMDCQGAFACGVLTLERGGGSGAYHHDEPTVHGMWPEVNPYGNSNCFGVFTPDSPGIEPGKLPACYAEDASLADHEWKAHLYCAAKQSPGDIFNQTCNLAYGNGQPGPLQVMTTMKAEGRNLSAIAAELTRQGYPVWNPDAGHDQLELSVCAGTDGRWKFSTPEGFNSVCGSS